MAEMTDGRDVLSIPASAVHAMEALGWKTTAKPKPAQDPAELKGRALDDALRAAGLPVTGKAAEKRAALAGVVTNAD